MLGQGPVDPAVFVRAVRAGMDAEDADGRRPRDPFALSLAIMHRAGLDDETFGCVGMRLFAWLDAKHDPRFAQWVRTCDAPNTVEVSEATLRAAARCPFAADGRFDLDAFFAACDTEDKAADDG